MSHEIDAHLAELRTALADAAKIEDLAERTLEVVAIVDEVASPLAIHPVVVGGMAVYFWTENEAFVTYDIDVVMAVTDRLRVTLANLGFEMSRDRRHWRLAGSEIFLEAPSADLDADAVIAEITLPSGRTARLLSQVDVLLDRLAEFQATGQTGCTRVQLGRLVLCEVVEQHEDLLGDDRAFGRAVREVRARRGLSQEALGQGSGLHRNYVGAIERGEICPTLGTLDKLAVGLDLSLPTLLTLYERNVAELDDPAER